MLVSPVQVWASAPEYAPLVGDRLTAGLRTLDPSIGVRIPVPQPNTGQECLPRIVLYKLLFADFARVLDNMAAIVQR